MDQYLCSDSLTSEGVFRSFLTKFLVADRCSLMKRSMLDLNEYILTYFGLYFGTLHHVLASQLEVLVA